MSKSPESPFAEKAHLQLDSETPGVDGTLGGILPTLLSQTVLEGPSNERNLPGGQRLPGLWRQATVLSRRAHKIVYRNWIQLLGLVAQAALLGTVISLTYIQLPEVGCCSMFTACEVV